MIVAGWVPVNGAVTTFDAIVEGTPYWLAPLAPRAKNFLRTIFFQLFFVDQVVPRTVTVMLALHLSLSLLRTVLKAHNREGEEFRIEICDKDDRNKFSPAGGY